ncbi:MAG: RsmD family RNA methyltransferase, partial [Chthoniobacterales bacterium]
FAGTGSLGIEALSRGAASAFFVEKELAAVAAIERNFVRTKVRGRVTRQDVFRFLSGARRDERFDVIFADPPYDETPDGEHYTDLLLASSELAAMLAPDGTFVLEKRPNEQLPSAVLWNVTRTKKYGATEVLFLKGSGSVARAPTNAG